MSRLDVGRSDALHGQQQRVSVGGRPQREKLKEQHRREPVEDVLAARKPERRASERTTSPRSGGESTERVEGSHCRSAPREEVAH